MKLTCYLKFVLILIIFDCRPLYGEMDSCTLSITQRALNVCDNSGYLVYISESVCGVNREANCWCILVDNRNLRYNGKEVKIEMDKSFRVSWERAIRTDQNDNPEIATFNVGPEINQIYLQPFSSSSPAPNLKSFKIDGNEICNKLSKQTSLLSEPSQQEDYVIPNNGQLKISSHAYEGPQIQNSDDSRFRFLQDCEQRPGYTLNSQRFCPNDDRKDFTIENRYTSQGDRYWCIVFDNERNLFSSEHHLTFSYTTEGKFLAWIPSDSLIAQNITESVFHLGNRKTIIVISANDSRTELARLNTITIDGYSVCNFEQKTVEDLLTPPPPPPPPQSPSLVSQPEIIAQPIRQIIQSPSPPIITPSIDTVPPSYLLQGRSGSGSYQYQYNNTWSVRGTYTIPPARFGETAVPQYEIHTDVKKFSNFMQSV